jgi:Xaa-Pro aminopeptidase
MTNLEKFRQRLAQFGVEFAVVTNMDNVRWLSGFTGSSAYTLTGKDRGVFITDSRYSDQAVEQVSELEVHIYSTPQTLAQAAAAYARQFGAETVGFESEHVSVTTSKLLEKEFAGIGLVPIDGLVSPLRMVKSEVEIAKMREACALADACYSNALRMIQPGVAEYDIALDIEFYFRRHHAEIAFPPIVVSGERSARPHGAPSEKKLDRGDFVTMDFGAKVDGYCSDLTRTVIVAEASDRQISVYEAVLNSQLAAIEAVKPGMQASEVDAISRNMLGEAGLAEYFGHGLGHGLGTVVHDVGRMGPTSTDAIEVGQVWTIEPGVYIPGFGGVRIEDDIVVTPDGCELLTYSPKQLQVI